jgi:hypothetical protein
MDAIVRTPVHRRTTLHFLVDGLQVWVSYLAANNNGPFGVKIQWLEHKYACSPLEHITTDGGHSYQQVENYMMLSGMDKRMVGLETDPEKLNRLQNILTAYRQKLGETV